MSDRRAFACAGWATAVGFVFALDFAFAAGNVDPPVQGGPAAASSEARALADVLPEAEWRRTEAAVDRGLAWLATTQQADGAFFCPRDAGQPAVTSLAVMAFLSAGHRPGEGPYGDALDRAIRFALSTQQEDGLYSFVRPRPPHADGQPSHTAAYNHAITGTMLCEAYGMAGGETDALIRASVPKALGNTRAEQTEPKSRPGDRGGWRYVFPSRDAIDSDLSVTAWQLTFFRSARNAEFPVPQRFVDDGVDYVRRCYVGAGKSPDGVFSYFADRPGPVSYAMTGARALSLALSGRHSDPMVAETGEWLRRHPIRAYEGVERFHYASYYASQAAAQVGGDCWREFYPPLVRAILSGQQDDGRWVGRQNQAEYGDPYHTSLSILALTSSYQLLPIYQR